MGETVQGHAATSVAALGTAAHPDDGAPERELGTGRKLLLSAAAIGVSLAVAVTGTYAAFSASVSRGHTVSTGVPVLAFGATGAPTNRLDIDAVGLSPGDSLYRAFDVTNAGSTVFTSFTLSAVATTSSILDTDTTNGLKVRLERCSVAWTESGSAPRYSYTCSGTRSTVLTSRPAVMTAQPLTGMQAGAQGGTDHLLLTETLPATADNTFQNKTSALTFTVDAA